jgi:UDP-N-acetylmuramoylalanine--D-glutamate ligase
MLATAATLMRVDRQAQEAVIRSFKGLAHRIELVDVIDGIKYINSSIDTTPERCAKTLSSLCGRTVVIICGKSKGASICPLIEALHSYTVGAVLMGEMGYEVLKNISTDTRFSGYPVKLCDNMKDAVLHGTKMLDKSGTLVLSAAATSYDMYSSFEERGKDFIRSVNSLKIN